MANIKISELTALTPPDAADLVPVTDSSASQTKRTTVGEIVGIINGDVDVADDGTATISELPVSKLQDGAARQLLQTDAAGTGVEWTSNVDVPGTLDVTSTATLDAALNVAGLASLDGGIDVDGAFTVADTSGNVATSGTLGVTGQSTLASAAVSDLTSGRVVLAGTSGELEDNAGLTFNGTQLDVDGNVVITGDLTVEGASTILETETVKVEDKNIELGVVTSPTDVTADGGGITLKGTTDKTINWIDATNAWTSSERFSVPLGTGAAPSLTFTGDPNTGIYSPGADQVALSTGGTGRLFVDANGNVGLGITPVANTLIGAARGSSLPGLIELAGNGNTVGTSGFAIGQDGSGVGVLFQRANAAMYFATNGTERLRITSDGKVGLGTSTLRQVAGATANLQNERTGAEGGAALSLLTNSSSGVASQLTLGASRGAAGTPTSVLSTDVVGTINFFGADGTDCDKIVASVRARAIGTITSDRVPGQLEFYTAENDVGSTLTQRLTIDNQGRVGVGTTSPTALLDVSSDVLRLRTAKTPASATDTGNAGDICWDADYVYVCIATNTWKRSALSTW